MSRRDLLCHGALSALAAGAGAALGSSVRRAEAQAAVAISMQFAWFLNSQAAGELVAIAKGYYRDAGIDLKMQPGGPALDPIQVVAGGGTTFGDVASIGVLLNARSRGLPIKAFGTVLQKHPFAFFFLKSSGIRTPKDFDGKTIGIQPTARPLLDAVLRKHQVSKDRVKVIFVGGDIAPLATHQVDVITGWVIDRLPLFTNLGLGGQIGYFRLWDLGIRQYAYTYFTTDQAYTQRRDVLARFLSASAKGWMDARDHPEEAIDIVLRSATGLNRALEITTLRNMGEYFTSIATKQYGWGYMDPKVWAELSDTYVALEQMPRPVKPDEIMTNELVAMAKTPKV
ncbi:MAG TPA: ABC transporter substrate-binding protein [bacterium]|nr:ABC transporter substrate-binding protein [bacterium]